METSTPAGRGGLGAEGRVQRPLPGVAGHTAAASTRLYILDTDWWTRLVVDTARGHRVGVWGPQEWTVGHRDITTAVGTSGQGAFRAHGWPREAGPAAVLSGWPVSLVQPLCGHQPGAGGAES